MTKGRRIFFLAPTLPTQHLPRQLSLIQNPLRFHSGDIFISIVQHLT
jgi:hypothetical protein